MTELRRLMKASAVVWLVMSVGSTAQMYVFFRLRTDAPSLLETAAIQAPRGLFWWLATPLVWWLVRRFPAQHAPAHRVALSHAAAASVLAFFPGMMSML